MFILLVNFQKQIYRRNNWKMYMFSTQFKDSLIEKFCHINVLGFLWGFFGISAVFGVFHILPLHFFVCFHTGR